MRVTDSPPITAILNEVTYCDDHVKGMNVTNHNQIFLGHKNSLDALMHMYIWAMENKRVLGG